MGPWTLKSLPIGLYNPPPNSLHHLSQDNPGFRIRIIHHCSGRGALGSYNAEAYDALQTFMLEEPLKDGDEWVAKLMRKNKMLGTPKGFSSRGRVQGLGFRA